MFSTQRLARVLATTVLAIGLIACAPKVGSERWCESMSDKPKGDWSANDAAAYTKKVAARRAKKKAKTSKSKSAKAKKADDAPAEEGEAAPAETAAEAKQES